MKILLTTIVAVLCFRGFVGAETIPTIAAPATVVLPAAPTVTYYVSPTGNDANPGTQALPKKTLKPTGSKQAWGLMCGGVYTTAGINFENYTDITVDYWGDLSKPIPVLYAPAATNILSFSPANSRICIKNVGFDSTWTAAKTAGGYAYHSPVAEVGNVHGTDIKFAGCELHNLSEGIVLEGVTRCLITNLVQVEPLGLPARCVMINDATDLTMSGCIFLNSINESPLRATGDGSGGGIVRGLITNTYVGQLLDSAHGRSTTKAAITIRQGSDITFTNVSVVNAPFSINTNLAATQTIKNFLISGGSVTGSYLELENGSSLGQFIGITINNQTGSPCVGDNAGMAGHHYESLTLNGAKSGIRFGAASNAVIEKAVVWKPSVAGMPRVTASDPIFLKSVVVK